MSCMVQFAGEDWTHWHARRRHIVGVGVRGGPGPKGGGPVQAAVAEETTLGSNRKREMEPEPISEGVPLVGDVSSVDLIDQLVRGATPPCGGLRHDQTSLHELGKRARHASQAEAVELATKLAQIIDKAITDYPEGIVKDAEDHSEFHPSESRNFNAIFYAIQLTVALSNASFTGEFRTVAQQITIPRAMRVRWLVGQHGPQSAQPAPCLCRRGGKHMLYGELDELEYTLTRSWPQANNPHDRVICALADKNLKVADRLVEASERICAVERRRTQSEASSSKIRNLQRDLEERVLHREAKALTVMVFGTGKNGKSTTLNALLGERLLPSGTTTCTGNSTEMVPVKNAAGEEIVRIHDRDQPHDEWRQESLLPVNPTVDRMSEEWVTNERIDRISIQHKHDIFRRNVKLLDVPGLNQDASRDEMIKVEIENVDVLLIILSAVGATGGMTLDERNQLQLWKQRMDEDRVFVICNKMDMIAVDASPIPRPKAISLLAEHGPYFQGKKKKKQWAGKSLEEKIAYLEEDFGTTEDSDEENTKDVELDKLARVYLKPDTQKVRQKVEHDIRGIVVTFTAPAPLGLVVDMNAEIVRISDEARESHPEQMEMLSPKMVITRVGSTEVKPAWVGMDSEQKRAHVEALDRLINDRAERPLEVQFGGLFPKMKDDSIHYVSAQPAMQRALVGADPPAEFEFMRKCLWDRLKTMQENHLLERPWLQVQETTSGLLSFVHAALDPARKTIDASDTSVQNVDATLEKVEQELRTFNDFVADTIKTSGAAKLRELIQTTFEPEGDTFKYMDDQRQKILASKEGELERIGQQWGNHKEAIEQVRKEISDEFVRMGMIRFQDNAANLKQQVLQEFQRIVNDRVANITAQMDAIAAEMSMKTNATGVTADASFIQWSDVAARVTSQTANTVAAAAAGTAVGGAAGAAGGAVLAHFAIGAGVAVGAASGAAIVGVVAVIAVAGYTTWAGGNWKQVEVKERMQEVTVEDLDVSVKELRANFFDEHEAALQQLDEQLTRTSMMLKTRMEEMAASLKENRKDMVKKRENSVEDHKELEQLLLELQDIRRDCTRNRLERFDVQETQLVPTRDSPVSGRTFANSSFKAKYDSAPVPAGVFELGALLTKLIEGHCKTCGIDYDEFGAPFIKRLNAEAVHNADELTTSLLIPEAVQRMWTSAVALQGREFCSILNDAIRRDVKGDGLDAAAGLARAMNELCVTVTGDLQTHGSPRTSKQLAGGKKAAPSESSDGSPRTPKQHTGGEITVPSESSSYLPKDRTDVPPEGRQTDWPEQSFRGGGFNDEFRSFFVPGRTYRQPAFLPTSLSRDVAAHFIERSSDESKVMWIVHLDHERHCDHVNFVTKTVPDLGEEEEFLFAPYSVFTVLRAEWRAGTATRPHVIELYAAPDNLSHPLDLPLAPWS